jgi:hypothetical protein
MLQISGASVLGTDEGSTGYYATAREHLTKRCSPLQLGIELDRYRTAARSLVTTPWACDGITRIAAALLRYGSLRTDLRTDLLSRHARKYVRSSMARAPVSKIG